MKISIMKKGNIWMQLSHYSHLAAAVSCGCLDQFLYILEISPRKLKLANGMELEIGKNRKKQLEEKMAEYSRRRW
jgi:hypothetical protein